LTLRKTLAAAGLSSLVLGAAAMPARAATTVVAKGLDNPRGLAVGPDGAVYVAQAGRSGKTCLSKDTCLGFSGALSKIALDGSLSDVAAGLLSAGGPDGTFTTGVDDVAVGLDGTAYGIMTAAPPDAKGIPAKAKKQLAHVIKAENGKPVPVGPRVDTIELKKNPDHTDVNPNPYGLAVGPDGTFYVADAGGNTIYSVKGNTLKLLSVLPKLGTGKRKAQAVPTVVRIGPDGALYVGVLGGEPATSKTQAVVFRVPIGGGKATVYAKGFTSVTGLAFDKAGNLYVTEFSRTTTKQGPKGDGDVVRIAADGTRTRLGRGDLTFPAGVAVGPDDAVYVANFSILPGTTPKKSPFKGAGGQVVKITP
jgi:sugar lactone lactonase YvrE